MDPYPAADVVSFDRGAVLLAIASQGGTVLSVSLLFLFILSFLIAGNEAALFSLQKKELDVLRTKQHPAARRIVGLLTHPKELYVTFLMAGTFVNVCIILLFNYLLLQWIPWNITPHWLRSLLILLTIVAVLYFFAR